MRTQFSSAVVGAALVLGAAISPAKAAVTASAIETFLGLGSGALDALNDQSPTVGSAIKQSVTIGGSSSFSFSWNFLTNEFDADDGVFDLAFYTIDGTAYFLEDADPATLPAPPPFFVSSTPAGHETGYSTTGPIGLDGGTHEIGFGVVHTGDEVVESALLLDALVLPGLANPGFETGTFSGWMTIGTNLIETASIGAGPVEGTFQALILAEEAPDVVPLPAALPLFGSGLAALGLLGWRRKQGNAI